MDPRKLMTPLIHGATFGIGVTFARRSTPCMCSALRASSHPSSEKTRYCSPSTTGSAGTIARSFGSRILPKGSPVAVSPCRCSQPDVGCDSCPVLRCNIERLLNLQETLNVFYQFILIKGFCHVQVSTLSQPPGFIKWSNFARQQDNRYVLTCIQVFKPTT